MTAPTIPLCPTPDAHPTTCPCPRRTGETYYGQPITTTRDISSYQEQHVSDDPRFFIRPPGGDFIQVTEEELLAAGPGQAACAADCSEGHTYEGRCAQSEGNACVWPDCLSDGQQTELAAQVLAAERGEETAVGPDQRVICGCDEAPAPDDAVQAAEARRYGEQVNAPLSERTIAALRDRLANGDLPIHTVGRCSCGGAGNWQHLHADRHDPVATSRNAPNLRAQPPVFPWAQTIDSADGGHTVRIPWQSNDGQEAGGVLVSRGDAAVLRNMLDGLLDEDELTADEARDLADRLSTDLYRAQDALAFVEECCVIADREGRPVTTARVRQWLQGPKCGRQMAAGVADGPTQLGTSAAGPNETCPGVGTCPGVELNPNPCTCTCEGCRHHCGAHQPVAARRTLTDLREQYAAAIREVCGEGPWEAIVQRSTDAIMAIRDDDMDATEDEMERRGRAITGLQAQLQKAQAAIPDRAQAAIRALEQQVAVRDRQLAAIRALLAAPGNSRRILTGDLRTALDGAATP